MSLPGPKLRELKGKAQLLEPAIRVGKSGVDEAFFSRLDELFQHHDLVKVRFDSHKEEKKELVPVIAEKSGATLVLRVGNTATYYRPRS